MSMFSGAKGVKMFGGTLHAEGQGANMFDNASDVKATGTTFTTGPKSPVDERGPPEKGNGPRMFKKLKDSEFKNITAEARTNSEMFEDVERVEFHASNLKVDGQSYGQPPIQVETGILTPNPTSIPAPMSRPALLESRSEHAPTLGVPGVTGEFLEAPPLRHSTSNPISPSHAEAESTFASTVEPSLSACSRMGEVGNTTANTTPDSLSAYSAELVTGKAEVNQAPVHDGSKKKKFKRYTQRFKGIFGVKSK